MMNKMGLGTEMNQNNCFVTDGARYLVQIPDQTPWGFSLHDDDQSWSGGFGSGMKKWWTVPAEDVPQDAHERLDWLFGSNGDGEQ